MDAGCTREPDTKNACSRAREPCYPNALLSLRSPKVETVAPQRGFGPARAGKERLRRMTNGRGLGFTACRVRPRRPGCFQLTV
jgi:hypothetical protein